jgi:TP901 family phage tail tape measure protein
MPDFAVVTVFSGKDRVTQAFKRMGKGADAFGDKTTAAFRKASKSGSSFGGVLKGILAASVIQRGAAAIQQGIGAATTEFIGFDQAITSATAKFKDLNTATTVGQRTLMRLKKTARDVGATTQFSAAQAAGGLDFLAMAGFTAEQSIATLPGVVDLATVANVDLARATDIASDSLGAFGMMTKNTAQLQKNFTRINDVMAATMTSANTDMETLFEAVKKGGPTFTSTGQRIETFSALIGIMANAGVKGEESGTQLRNVMLRLADPTKEATGVLKKLGIVTQDQNGNFRDIVDILADFEKGLKGMGNQQRAAALSTIFGVRAVTGINLLLQEGTGTIRKFRSELDRAGGSSQRMADIMRQSLQNRLLSLRSAAIEFGFKIFEAFEKRGAKGIDSLTDAIRRLDPKPLISAIETSIKVFGTLLGILRDYGPALKVIVGGMIAYNAALKIAALIQFVSVLRTAAVAQGILNAVMMANPIGLIIGGVTLLIAVVVMLYKHWDTVVWGFTIGAKAIGQAFVIAGKLIKLMFIDPIVYWIARIIKGILTITSVAGKFVGIDTAGLESLAEKFTVATPASGISPITAPNKAEVEARQNIGFQGRLEIAGAPAGSKVESSTTGAPAIQIDMLGANP